MSSCLLCLYGIPLLNLPKGRPGDPIGLCKTCSSMSCGWHGARLRTPPFICIICDVNNLLASAGWDDFKANSGLNRLPPGVAPGARGEPPATPMTTPQSSRRRWLRCSRLRTAIRTRSS